jgi:hypothetical protein
MGGHIYEKAGNMPVAYHFFRQATEQNPRDGTNWMNFGRAAEELWRTPEAEKAYAKALKYADRDETTRCTLGNLSALCIDNARYEEAIAWANKCLDRWPDDAQTLANVGFAKLGLGHWSDGWKFYRNILGTAMRTRITYGSEPEWDGTPGKNVVLYGEQGIGDEISFASMVPDAIKVCNKVVLDCDLRLANLFSRSFPKARVYGTRKSRPHNEKIAKWAPEDRQIDASLAIGQVGEYFRTDLSMFPGTPYLVPDPDRTLMWKSLWATKAKPVIGIAWNGGIPRTGSHMRKWNLEDLVPILSAVDAHWVVLEYKPAGADLEAFRAAHTEIDIKEYPHATLTKDYDDTAALVASLDMVFCIQTAVAHLGGALGVPTWVCVPPCSQWRYGTEGETIPWYQSVKVIRQQKGEWNFSQIAEELSANFRRIPPAAAYAPRINQLWNGGGQALRSPSSGDHRPA